MKRLFLAVLFLCGTIAAQTNVRANNGTFSGAVTAGAVTAGTVNTGLVNTSGTQLLLKQTGDSLGTTSLALENRTGANGGIFTNNSIALADLGFAANTTITNIAITGNVVTVTTPATGNGWQVGNTVTLTGLTTATFLNGALLTIGTAAAGSFTAAFTHADYASAPDTGTVQMQNNMRSEFRPGTLINAANVSGEVQFVQIEGTVGGGTIGSNTWFASGPNGTYLKGGLTLPGATSGTTIVKPAAIASGTVTFPAATATLGGEYPSADHVIYVSTQGNDANDGLSPGTARATVQAAFNAATTSGTVAGAVIVAPGAYACPTTWYSNMAVMGVLPLYSGTFAGSIGTSVSGLDGVTFNCTAANVTWTLLSNLHISGINLNFGNAGFGLVMNSVSASEFYKLTLTGAGNSTQPALQAKTNATTNPANNTAFNRFYDLTIIANFGGVQSADCITLTGSGAVNAGTFVTDNEFHGMTCTGGIKNGIRFELNSDTNRFYGVNLNNTGPAAGDGVVFNSVTPASDQDSDNEEVYGICETGGFSHSISMGAANGNVITTCGGATIVPNILGGSPTYIVTTSGEFGVAPSIEVHGGAIRFSNMQAAGPAPTCSFTGGGTGSPTCAVQTGSSNSAGLLVLTTGTTAAASGTITITFNGTLGTNDAGCEAEPVNGSQNWAGGVTHNISAHSTSAVTWTWTNAGSALLNTSGYAWQYHCDGR